MLTELLGKTMRRIAPALLTTTLFLAPIHSYEQTKKYQTKKNLPITAVTHTNGRNQPAPHANQPPLANDRQQTAGQQCIPHYLENIYQPEDPLESILEKERVYRSMQGKYPGTNQQQNLDGTIEIEKEIQGKKITFHFPQYVQRGETIYHYHALGVETYTPEQFSCIVEDQVNYLKQAADWAMQDYTTLLKTVLETQEKTLKEQGVLKKNEKLEDMLDKEIPGYGIKLREVLFTPDIKIQDFLPEHYTFGEIPMQGVLGVAYLQMGRVGIDPKARVLDYLNGIPTVLIHEMTHNNPKLQNIPFSSTVDVELWASFPMLAYDDMQHFLRHSYLRDVHKVAKILFNFDNQKAYDDLIHLNLATGTELEKENKYEKAHVYIAKVKEISKEIRSTVFETYIPLFFSNPLYFMALNDFLRDKNAAFKLVMYLHYEPTLLGGPEKTKKFIKENESIIEQTTMQVMRELKEKRSEEGKKKESEQIKQRQRWPIEEIANRVLAHSEFGEVTYRELSRAAAQLGLGNSEDLLTWGRRLYRLGLIEIPPEAEIEIPNGVLLEP